jgi:hypothetical protein
VLAVELADALAIDELDRDVALLDSRACQRKAAQPLGLLGRQPAARARQPDDVDVEQGYG